MCHRCQRRSVSWSVSCLSVCVAADGVEAGAEVRDGIFAWAVVYDFFGVVAPGFPFLAERVDVPEHVDGRGMSRRQVFGFDLRPAGRAVKLQDAAEGRVRREGEFILLRVDPRE